MQVMKQLACS